MLAGPRSAPSSSAPGWWTCRSRPLSSAGGRRSPPGIRGPTASGRRPLRHGGPNLMASPDARRQQQHPVLRGEVGASAAVDSARERSGVLHGRVRQRAMRSGGEFPRNDALDARNTFSIDCCSVSALGGPIIKNKIWLFNCSVRSDLLHLERAHRSVLWHQRIRLPERLPAGLRPVHCAPQPRRQYGPRGQRRPAEPLRPDHAADCRLPAGLNRTRSTPSTATTRTSPPSPPTGRQARP